MRRGTCRIFCRILAAYWRRFAHWRSLVAIPTSRPCPPLSREARPLLLIRYGLPPGQFQKLVQDLNKEAQSRRLAVISRDQPSAYRVRGYLAVKVTKHQTIVSWVWDVFDQEEQRALRISGEENAKIRHRDAWTVADDAMLRRIAENSMGQLAAFLTSPEVAPGTSPPAEEARVAAADMQQSSPEAAGIYRVSRPQADPISTDGAGADRGCQRPAAVAAPAGACGLIARDSLTMAAMKPLTVNSSCRRKLRTNI